MNKWQLALILFAMGISTLGYAAFYLRPKAASEASPGLQLSWKLIFIGAVGMLVAAALVLLLPLNPS